MQERSMCAHIEKLSFRISQLPPKLGFLNKCSFSSQSWALSSVIQAAERGLFTNYLTLESANMFCLIIYYFVWKHSL